MPDVITTEGLFTGELRQLPGAGSLTGLFKTPAAGPLRLEANGLEGDRQADRAHHGGPERALNHYPAEHYDHWQATFPDHAGQFVPGALGENVSTRGLTEADVCVGDVFRLGGARIQVSQPRYPCWKIARRLGLPELAKVVAASGRAGWLYRVLEPGSVSPGDVPELKTPAAHGVTLERLWSVRNDKSPDRDELAELAELPDLAESWRYAYATRLDWFRRKDS